MFNSCSVGQLERDLRLAYASEASDCYPCAPIFRGEYSLDLRNLRRTANEPRFPFKRDGPASFFVTVEN